MTGCVRVEEGMLGDRGRLEQPTGGHSTDFPRLDVNTPVAVVDAEPYASIPAAPRASRGTSSWLELQQRPQAGSFIESLRTRGDELYLVDVAWGRILRVLSDGTVETMLEYEGNPNGLALRPDGSGLIADYEHGLLEVDAFSHGVAPVPRAQRYGLDRFRGLNDVIISSSGEAFFSDQGGSGLQDPTGRIYRLQSTGNPELLLDRIPSPNSLVLDEVASVLFVAVTRDNSVWRIPLRRDGALAKVGRYIQLSGGGGPDGLALTSRGGLLVTQLGLGLVWLFDDRGWPVRAYRCGGGPDPTSVAVSHDGRSVLIAEATSGTVLIAPLGESEGTDV